MESKNVHLVDEHSINRDGNIICSMDIDGSDYVLYWIERDNDHNNLFVSKLIKNTDGTSNMMNIEDQGEKAKVVDVVKQLVTHSIKNEADTLAGNKVTLGSGKEVMISGVLFNKEQKFEIAKTYVTTVEKPVTKVCEDFYKVEVPSKVEEQSVEPVVSPVVDEAMPELETVAETSVEEGKTEEEKIMDSLAEGVVPASVETSVVPEVKVEEPVVNVPVTPVPATEPVLATPAEPVAAAPVAAAADAPEEVEARMNIIASPEDATVEVESTVTPAPVEVKPEEPEIPVVTAPEPVVVPPVVTPPVEELKAEPVAAVAPAPAPATPELVFDASKETNLSLALGEVTTDKPLPVENVETIREFGQDEPVMATPAVAAVPEPEEEVIPAPAKGRGGFANNKFFMVIAIAFFVAACVFLGYEVFQYFQLTK